MQYFFHLKGCYLTRDSLLDTEDTSQLHSHCNVHFCTLSCQFRV
uniref:Uncharacterized protein n=1 Tax=Rhizophora mucronata TaxID=61149 RepID=A0A2P2N443_RHIMU